MAHVKELSIFIDESGDLGKYDTKCPFYIVSLVFLEQSNDISSEIQALDDYLIENKLQNKAIHAAPLIRREKEYKFEDIQTRRKLFKKLFDFVKKINISYKTIVVDKRQFKEKFDILRYISKELFLFLYERIEYFKNFDKVIIYYDDGQYDLSKTLTIIFGTILNNSFEYKTICPANYKLFQTADLICTLSLIKNKLEEGKDLTNSEKIFFRTKRDLRKNYLKMIEKMDFEVKYSKFKVPI